MAAQDEHTEDEEEASRAGGGYMVLAPPCHESCAFGLCLLQTRWTGLKLECACDQLNAFMPGQRGPK